jgi:lipoyl-dependent peroxiredoxin
VNLGHRLDFAAARRHEIPMPIRSAQAEWNGNLREGTGRIVVESGTFDAQYGFKSRFENGPGTNPEELIAAAHAGCFSMALSAALAGAGKPVRSVRTTAKVHVDKVADGFKITRIELATVGEVPGLDEAGFQDAARKAKEGCPVSRALAGTEIVLDAKLARG